MRFSPLRSGTVLITLAVLSLLASQGIPLLGAGDAPRPAKMGDPTTATAEAPVDRNGAPGTTRPAAPHDGSAAAASTSRDTPTRTELDAKDTSPSGPVQDASIEVVDLDRAAPEEIRQVLEYAVERAVEERAFMISPGLIDAIADRGQVRIVFETRLASDLPALDRLLDGNRGARVEELRVFSLLDQAAASVGPQALLHLVDDVGTSSIELDAVHRPSLDLSVAHIGGHLAHAAENDGDGFAVAILDTGVDTSHPFFEGRVAAEACFSVEQDCPNGERQMFGPGSGAPCPIAGCGHGTIVAGIAVGDDPDGVLIGAAPHAQLIVIQVFSDVDDEPGAYSSDILAGMQHVLALTAFHSIASLNLSLGGSPYTSEASCNAASPARLNAVQQLRGAGVLTVAAAGNESLTNAITIPGCLSNVLSVGATALDDTVLSFSNSAEFLSLLAPGEIIESTSMGGGTTFANGTSMATPHVSGAIAVLREARPAATVVEIENALALTGVAVLDGRNGLVAPRIQIEAAITLLDSAASVPVDLDPPATGSGAGSSSGNSTASSSSSGGGGGGCGLVGIEPFLVLGLIRLGRHGRQTRTRAALTPRHCGD